VKSLPYVRVLLVLAVFLGIAYFFAVKNKSASHTALPGQTGQSGDTPSNVAAVTVTGIVGGEKIGFLTDPAVLNILRDKYGITLNTSKAGSIEMVKGSTAGQDFLWPSSQVAGEIYKERGGKQLRSDTVFSSPIVLYSWAPVVDQLIKQGIVRQLSGAYYIVDFPKLIAMINAGKQWKDIGLTDLYGRVSIRSTDPAKSNSGMMFAGLLANTLNNDVATADSVSKELPTLKVFFGRLGYMEGSSGDLFTQFVTQGEGQNPIIVGYENQLTEYTLEHQDYKAMIQSQIRILYPRPTVWSDHPLIALTDNGSKLLTALHDDPELRRLAWEGHGFRTGLQNDPAKLQVSGIPATIQNVVPMPKPRVMDIILKALSEN